MENYGFLIKGSLKSIRLYDLRLHVNIPLIKLGSDDEDIFIDYSINVYTRKKSRSYPGYPFAINVNLKNLTFIGDFKFIYFIKGYIKELTTIINKDINNEIELEPVKEIPKNSNKKEFSLLNLTFSKIKFVLPEDDHSIETSYVYSEIEKIKIYNEITRKGSSYRQLSDVHFEVTNVNSCTYSQKNNEKNTNLIVNNYSYTCELIIHRNIYVDFHLPDIVMAINPIQINFFFNMYDRNLKYFFKLFTKPSKNEQLVTIEEATSSRFHLLSRNTSKASIFGNKNPPPKLKRNTHARSIGFTLFVKKIMLDIYRTSNTYLYSETNSKNNSEPLCRFEILNGILLLDYYNSIFNFYIQINSLNCIDISKNSESIVDKAKTILSFGSENNIALMISVKKLRNYYDIDIILNDLIICPTSIIFDILKWIKIDIPIISKNNQKPGDPKVININYHIYNSILYIILNTKNPESKAFLLCFTLEGSSPFAEDIISKSEYHLKCHYAKIEFINTYESYYVLSPFTFNFYSQSNSVTNAKKYIISTDKSLSLTLSYKNIQELISIYKNIISLYSDYAQSIKQFVINNTKSDSIMEIILKDGLDITLIHRYDSFEILPLFQFSFKDINGRIEHFSQYEFNFNLSALYYNQTLSLYEPLIEDFILSIVFNRIIEENIKCQDLILNSQNLNVNITTGLIYTITTLNDSIKNNDKNLMINNSNINIENNLPFQIEILLPRENHITNTDNKSNLILTTVYVIINKFVKGVIQYNIKRRTYLLTSFSNPYYQDIICSYGEVYNKFNNSMIYHNKNNPKQKYLVTFYSDEDFDLFYQFSSKDLLTPPISPENRSKRQKIITIASGDKYILNISNSMDKSHNFIQFRISNENYHNLNVDKCGYSFYNIYLSRVYNVIVDTSIQDKKKYVRFRSVLEISNKLDDFISIECSDYERLNTYVKTIDINKSVYIPDELLSGTIKIMTSYGDSIINLFEYIGKDIKEACNKTKTLCLINHGKITGYIILNCVIIQNPDKFNKNNFITCIKFELIPQFNIHNNLLCDIHYTILDSLKEIIYSEDLLMSNTKSVFLPIDITETKCFIEVSRKDDYDNNIQTKYMSNLFCKHPLIGRIKMTDNTSNNNYISYTIEITSDNTFLLHLFYDILFINNSGMDLWCAFENRPTNTELFCLFKNKYVITTKENNDIKNECNKIGFSFPYESDSNYLYFTKNPTNHKWSYKYDFRNIGDIEYYDIVIDGEVNEQLIIINDYYKELYKYTYVLEIKSRNYIYNISIDSIEIKQYGTDQKPLIVPANDNIPFNWYDHFKDRFLLFRPVVPHILYNWTEKVKFTKSIIPISISSHDGTENIFFNISRTRYKYSNIYLIEQFNLEKSNFKIINNTINFYIKVYQCNCGTLNIYTILPLENQGLALINPLKDTFIITFIPYIIDETHDIKLDNYPKGQTISIPLSFSDRFDEIPITFNGYDITITKDNTYENINNNILIITDNYLEKYDITMSQYVFNLYKLKSINETHLNNLENSKGSECKYILFHLLYSYGFLYNKHKYECEISSKNNKKTILSKTETINPDFNETIICKLDDQFKIALFYCQHPKTLLGQYTLNTNQLTSYNCNDEVINLSANLGIQMNIVKANSKDDCLNILLSYYYKRNIENIEHNISLSNDLVFYGNCLKKSDLIMKLLIEDCNIQADYRGFYIVFIIDNNTIISTNTYFLENTEFNNINDNSEIKPITVNIDNSNSISIECISYNYYLTVVPSDYENSCKRNLVGSQVLELNNKQINLYKDNEIIDILNKNVRISLKLIPTDNMFENTIPIDQSFVIQPQLKHNTYYKLFIYGIPFKRTEPVKTGKYHNYNGEYVETSLLNLGQKSIYDSLICGKELKYNTNIYSYNIILDYSKNISLKISFKYDEKKSDYKQINNNFMCKINNLGYSLISHEGYEIIYFATKEFSMMYKNNSNTGSEFKINIKDFQIDNGISNTLYPVLLFYKEKDQKENTTKKDVFYANMKLKTDHIIEFVNIYIEV